MDTFDIGEFDYIFFTDVNALLNGNISFLENTNAISGKIYILSSVVNQFNNARARLNDEEMSNFNRKATQITHLIKEGKISRLQDEVRVPSIGSVDLLFFLISRYYLNNVLVISNKKEEVRNCLSLVPIYSAFGKKLIFTALYDFFEPYEYDSYDEVMSHLLSGKDEFAVGSVAETPEVEYRDMGEKDELSFDDSFMNSLVTNTEEEPAEENKEEPAEELLSGASTLEELGSVDLDKDGVQKKDEGIPTYKDEGERKNGDDDDFGF